MKTTRHFFLQPLLGLLSIACVSFTDPQPLPDILYPNYALRFGIGSHNPTTFSLTFAGKKSGAVLSPKEIPSPAVLVPTVDQGNLFFRIDQYTVLLTVGKETFTRTCTGNTIPQDVLNRISTAPDGSTLLFKNVQCTTGDGTVRNMQSSYTIRR